MSSPFRSRRGWIVGLLGALLFVLHYDFWYWDDRSVVLGFLPVGLAWHAGISALASLAWALAVVLAWPSELEAWAEEAVAEEDTVDGESAG